jgi:hypothetical protein
LGNGESKVFMQKLDESSINKALSKASKVAEFSDYTTTPTDDKSDSSVIMMLHSNWRTVFMIYLKVGGLPGDKDEREGLRRWVGHYTMVGDELFR